MNSISVVKSPFRKYGYSLHYSEKQSYLLDGHNSGWYRFKRDALKRAEELKHINKG